MTEPNAIQVAYQDIVESAELQEPTPPRVWCHPSAEFSACRLQRMLSDKGIGIVVEVDDRFPRDGLWFVPLETVLKMKESGEWI